ncbi:MAG TPA: DUF4234 domain-containing protein [Candidatus Saccharimonadales bacterium]|nr:DUF4234 domain-containing protein [Candidatus Saccharimonadales bacterium]
MKQRVIWKMFVLTILTLGIYRLYWFVKTRREMMNLNPKVKIMSPLFLFIPIVLIVLSIGVFMVSTIRTVANQPAYCRTQSIGSSSNVYPRPLPKECRGGPAVWGILLIYASFFLFYPLVVIWLWGYSKGVEIISGGHTSFAIALVILILIPDGIDILVIQDGFNKLAEVPPAGNSSGSSTSLPA